MSVAVGAQDTKELISFVSKAVAAAEKGDFSNALKNYDRAIAIVAAHSKKESFSSPEYWAAFIMLD